MDIVQVIKEIVDPIGDFSHSSGEEGIMLAYVLVLVGVLSRYVVASHLPWLNFTAVTGSLLFFGARRSWREMLFPLGALMVSDYCLTVFHYGYPFRWQAYVITWSWYIMAMVLGQILLHAKSTFLRGAAGAILGPTAFWVVSDYGVWAGGNLYPHTLSGLVTCYLAAIPFYRNDLMATSLTLAAAFAIEALLRKVREPRAGIQPGTA
jgi:hypothetical protein